MNRRRFVIGDEEWSVYEDARLEAPHFGPALVFQTAGSARRVRTYPANWRELPDEQLYALSWSR
ncbi:MAG TPA: hypothetical protein VGH98_15290 [Gemmatimonadaceae bacterium]